MEMGMATLAIAMELALMLGGSKLQRART